MHFHQINLFFFSLFSNWFVCHFYLQATIIIVRNSFFKFIFSFHFFNSFFHFIFLFHFFISFFQFIFLFHFLLDHRLIFRRPPEMGHFLSNVWKTILRPLRSPTRHNLSIVGLKKMKKRKRKKVKKKNSSWRKVRLVSLNKSLSCEALGKRWNVLRRCCTRRMTRCAKGLPVIGFPTCMVFAKRCLHQDRMMRPSVNFFIEILR